jgi:hypothetical protein
MSELNEILKHFPVWMQFLAAIGLVGIGVVAFIAGSIAVPVVTIMVLRVTWLALAAIGKQLSGPSAIEMWWIRRQHARDLRKLRAHD